MIFLFYKLVSKLVNTSFIIKIDCYGEIFLVVTLFYVILYILSNLLNNSNPITSYHL